VQCNNTAAAAAATGRLLHAAATGDEMITNFTAAVKHDQQEGKRDRDVLELTNLPGAGNDSSSSSLARKTVSFLPSFLFLDRAPHQKQTGPDGPGSLEIIFIGRAPTDADLISGFCVGYWEDCCAAVQLSVHVVHSNEMK
jgi:hypothetical protein